MTGVQNVGGKPVRVFISYSHDSLDHMERVLTFANQLRQHGIEAVVDRYFEDTLNMRWTDWMNAEIQAATFVLIVATPGYAERLRPGAAESPGRGSSSNPSSRSTRNRSRHLQTVAPVTCTLLAAALLLNPSPHAKTMRARMAMACADLGRRASIASFSFSSGVKLSGLVGRPMIIS